MPNKTKVQRTALRRARIAGAVSLSVIMALTVAGCAHKGVGDRETKRSKTPVFGQRTSILGGTDVLEADPILASTPVLVPDAQPNPDWPQSGGSPAKALGHVALGAGTKLAWGQVIAGGGARAKLASPPVVLGGKLFVIDTEAVVHAYDAKTGARLWEKNIRSADDKGHIEFGGGVGADGDRVYATTGIGDVAALATADGKVEWKVRPGGPLRGSPTLSNGNVYVMSQDNQIFALNQSDGAVIWQDTGTLQSTNVFGVAAPAAGQGSVVAGFSSGELSAYRYENGRVLWGDALSRTNISTSVSTLTDIDADAVIDRGRVFAIGFGGRMASYELLTGQRLWELNIGGISTPMVAGEWVFVVTDKGRLFCIARTEGKVRWISDLPAYESPRAKKNPIRWHGPILAGGRLILVSTAGTMVYVTPADGKVQQTVKVKLPVSLSPIVADNMLYVLTESGRLLAYK